MFCEVLSIWTGPKFCIQSSTWVLICAIQIDNFIFTSLHKHLIEWYFSCKTSGVCRYARILHQWTKISPFNYNRHSNFTIRKHTTLDSLTCKLQALGFRLVGTEALRVLILLTMLKIRLLADELTIALQMMNQMSFNFKDY